MPDAFIGYRHPIRRRHAEELAGRGPTPIAIGDGAAARIDLVFTEYRKTATTFAVKMDEDFEVDTLEGRHQGRAGDWLAIGVEGELYPIAADVFARTYAPIGHPDSGA